MENVSGFGIGSLQDVQAINKALEGAEAVGIQTGYAWGGTDQTGGGALRVESLDSSLKVITFTDKHINFWKDIPKSPAYSTVEEYNQLTTYGNQAGGFLSEGQLPYTTTSDYKRRAALVKFLGTTRSVSHPMTLVRTMVPDVIAQENSNGIMWMLRQLENALFWGNSKGLDGGEYVEFDGLDTILSGAGGYGSNAGNTYDLRSTSFGTTPFTTIVNDLAQTVVDNFGFPTDIYIPFPILAKINEEFAGTAAQRIMLPTTTGNTQVNINIDGLMTQAGRVNLKPTFFLQKTKAYSAIATPLKTNTAISALTASASALGQAPTYAYPVVSGTAYSVKVSVENQYGEYTINSGSAITVAIDTTAKTFRTTINAAPGATGGTGELGQFVNIYVKAPSGSVGTDDWYWVQRIATTAAGVTFDWNGERWPGTYTSFIGQNTPDVLTFRQLAPLVKMDLATIAPAYKWMILLYGTPVIFAPLKWTRIINIHY